MHGSRELSDESKEGTNNYITTCRKPLLRVVVIGSMHTFKLGEFLDCPECVATSQEQDSWMKERC